MDMNMHSTVGLIRRALTGALLVMCCASCSGSESESDGDDDFLYVNFAGSANGEWVVDGQGNKVRFAMTTEFDTLEWNGEMYGVYMNHLLSNAVFAGDYTPIGSVVMAGSKSGQNVAVLVATDGYFLNISHNSNGGLHLEESTSMPVPPNSSGGGGGGGGNCSSKCESMCTGQNPEQACYYCQAACVCSCSQDACEQSNRASAQQLGTTCSY